MSDLTDKTFKDLGLPPGLLKKLSEAAQEPGKEACATPATLKAWIEDGNDLSDAVSGIGDKGERKIFALLGLPEKPVLEEPAEETEPAAAPSPEPEPPAAVVETPVVAPPEEKPIVKEIPKPEVVDVSMSVPLGTVHTGYEASQAVGGRVQFAKKTQVQLGQQEAEALLRIREGLLANNERLSNGKPIASNADVVRWFLSKVVDAAA